MALARARRPRESEYWPGFVGALSTMLIVLIFLLLVYLLAQIPLSREMIGKDGALVKLNRQIEQLTSQLALERTGKAEAAASAVDLAAKLEAAQQDKAQLQGFIDAGKAGAAEPEARIALAEQQLDAEKQVSSQALAQVETLNQQIAGSRGELGALQTTLAAAETRGHDQQAKIAELKSRLDAALAQKVEQLARYRSDFYDRLQQILGGRPGIGIVEDRFILQSEILFASGQASLNPAGRSELDKVASALVELEHAIPPDIPWMMRVDGHTDKKAIQSKHFGSNWALSSARAIAVVQYLIAKGVSPQRVAAAGFGEFQPLDPDHTEEAYRRNRRLELKLTER